MRIRMVRHRQAHFRRPSVIAARVTGEKEVALARGQRSPTDAHISERRLSAEDDQRERGGSWDREPLVFSTLLFPFEFEMLNVLLFFFFRPQLFRSRRERKGLAPEKSRSARGCSARPRRCAVAPPPFGLASPLAPPARCLLSPTGTSCRRRRCCRRAGAANPAGSDRTRRGARRGAAAPSPG